jgi:hypothetical protein
MSIVYNNIGSVTTIKLHLEKNNIHDFKSLKEVIHFQNSYSAQRQEILAKNRGIITKENEKLIVELYNLELKLEFQKNEIEIKLNKEIEDLLQKKAQLTSNFSRNIILRLSNKFRKWKCQQKINKRKNRFNKNVENSLREIFDEKKSKSARKKFIELNFEDVVLQSSQPSLKELNRKKTTIDEVNSFILGALGEQKVVKTLEALPENCHLINDFSISFSKAIYNSQENDYIRSIQIDHILVTPSGIFLIETKNWSEKSVNNLDLRSPVKQIKRTSFALFRILHDNDFQLCKHHWGDKKIPIKNLIVMINSKPKEEFQFVKTLTLNELVGYVKYFNEIFSDIETQNLAEYLNFINNQKTI